MRDVLSFFIDVVALYLLLAIPILVGAWASYYFHSPLVVAIGVVVGIGLVVSYIAWQNKKTRG